MNHVYELMASIGIEQNRYLYENDCLFDLLQMENQNIYKRYAKKKLHMNSLMLHERYMLLRDVFEAFQDIKYSVIKGAVLSKSAYGNEVYRNSGDVDLFISAKDIEEFKYRLNFLGFIQGYLDNDVIRPLTRTEIIFYSTSTHQLAPFIRQENGIINKTITVDVNFNIMWGESDFHLDLADFEDGIIKDNIFGYSIKKLCDIYEFITLCLHHYKDLNSIYLLYTHGFKIKHLCDIYHFLINHPNITPQQLYEMAQKYKIADYIYCCLLYTFCFFGDEYLQPYLKMLSSDSAKQCFQFFGLNTQEQRKWMIPFEKRILPVELKKYLDNILSKNDINKIETNKLMLHSF